MKVSLTLLICIFFSFTVAAQFFSSIPKPKAKVKVPQATLLINSKAQLQADEATAIVKNEFRPLANILSTGYQINHKNPDTEPGVITMYGAGVGYQHLVYNAVTEKWNAVWSIGALTYLSTHISGENMAANWYGLSFALWDNKVNFGAAIDLKSNAVITLGIGIPLNNL